MIYGENRDEHAYPVSLTRESTMKPKYPLNTSVIYKGRQSKVIGIAGWGPHLVYDVKTREGACFYSIQEKHLSPVTGSASVSSGGACQILNFKS